jgi:ataxia telangiectasia mutated family protein
MFNSIIFFHFLPIF